MSPSDEINRRTFLDRSLTVSAGLLGASLLPRAVAQDAPAASTSSNETIGLAFIGLGGRGSYLMRSRRLLGDPRVPRARPELHLQRDAPISRTALSAGIA